MTIASEIERLQCAKADIRQAIIDKGVDVCSDLTIDNYACCISDISSGPKYGYIDLLVVGGGGSGGRGCKCNCYGGGGGAGGFIECLCYPINSNTDTHNVTVGKGGCGSTTYGSNGGNSSFGSITAYGGGRGGGGYSSSCPCSGGSGGGGLGGYIQVTGTERCCFCIGCAGTAGQGCKGGNGCWQGSQCYGGGGGGGGAGGNGCVGGTTNQSCGGCGGVGKESSISGASVMYAYGGGGGSWSSSGNTYANCGSGGGGGGCCCGNYYGFDGRNGVVILRYKTDGSSGIKNTSSGGCKYTCGDYTIHCFITAGATEQFVPVFK